jgi:hypothetical protein
MKNTKLWILLILLSFGACQTSKLTSIKPKDETSLYQQSILNAMSPGPDKVYTNLVAINNQNQNLIRKKINNEEYILVVTWKQDTSYYKPDDTGFYNTRGYPIWVTTAPELLQRMKNETTEDVDYRLKQLLGLPPTSDYKYFIELWVKPGDLFRPCPDKEITDNRCDLCFPDNQDSIYISWINNLRIQSYYDCELYKKYPWTQLGYTYDWNYQNTSHIGLSEFVIAKNKNVVINKFYSTKDYLKNIR